MSFISWILLGALVGFIGSRIVNRTGHGVVRDVLLSIFGALFSGFLANLLGDSRTAGVDSYSLIVAAVGALVFLITYHGMFRRLRSSSNRDRRDDQIKPGEERSDVRGSNI